MELFNYRVISATGAKKRGSIEAKDETVAAKRLKQEGYYIIDLEAEQKNKVNKNILARLFTTITYQDLTAFMRQFATMIDSGLPLASSLALLTEQFTNSNLGAIINQIREDVEQGKMLSTAVGRHSNIFPDLAINMIAAGEEGDCLAAVVTDLATYFEKQLQLRKKLRAILAYPLFILAVACGLLVFIFYVVLPLFTEVFATYNLELPLITRSLLQITEILTEYWLVILLGLSTLVSSTVIYFKSKQGRFLLDRLLLKVPLINKLILKIMVTRITRTLGTLLLNGVSLLPALVSIEKIVNNKVVERKLKRVQQTVKEGGSLRNALESIGLLPEMVLQMVSVGEETGQLGGVLLKVADYYEQELETDLELITSLAEPVLILILSVIVAGVITSILLPIFNLINYL
ncbi:type II secretion system F family protein [Natroniella sulfidigena]|uniref:type II secretion system F family protein n=1 Tax=Natroniella sulfidigena TaxID=723921 RepID=UPI00200BA104|nr:type II secretion system F family protein [Natroniella sulfidigena]MCK8817482.1 type II secretion system F family protein [Natroniella sulfidigena]